MIMPRNRAGLVVAGLLASLATGCATSPPEQQQADVTQTIALATHGIQTYLVETNANERSLALQVAALDGAPIGPATLQGSFSKPSVEARISALMLLNAYVTKLTALADSDQPAAELESAKTLDARLATLPQSFAKLGASDASAGRYVQPATAVLAWVGETYTDSQRAQATATALQSAAPAAAQMLDLLGDDLKTIQSQRSTAADGIAQRELGYYNSHLRALSMTDRQTLLLNMTFSGDARARAQSTDGLALVDQLRQAHQALLTYVRSPRSTQDEIALGHAMAEFEAGVEPLASAARP